MWILLSKFKSVSSHVTVMSSIPGLDHAKCFWGNDSQSKDQKYRTLSKNLAHFKCSAVLVHQPLPQHKKISNSRYCPSGDNCTRVILSNYHKVARAAWVLVFPRYKRRRVSSAWKFYKISVSSKTNNGCNTHSTRLIILVGQYHFSY